MKCPLCDGAKVRRVMTSAMPYAFEERRCIWCKGTGQDSAPAHQVAKQQAALSKAHAAAKAGDEGFRGWLREAGRYLLVPVKRRNRIVDDYILAVQDAA